MSLAQLRAVRAVLRRLATPLAGDGEDGGAEEQQQQGEGDAGARAEKVFQERVLEGARLVFPRHAERKAEAQVFGVWMCGVGGSPSVCVIDGSVIYLPAPRTRSNVGRRGSRRRRRGGSG